MTLSPSLLRGALRLVALALVLGTAGARAQPTTTARYVDATGGDDANDGATPATAWKSLAKANAETFGPGGSLLFKDGEVWAGTLLPKGSGADGNVFTIGRYGDGAARPRIDGEGTAFTLLLNNQQYVEVTGLEITNFEAGVPDGQDPTNKRAIYVIARDIGPARHIVFRDIVVHDVNSGLNDETSSTSRYYGGLFAEVLGSTTPTYFDGLVVEDSHFYDVDRTAISNNSSWETRSPTSSFGEIAGGTQRDDWVPSVGVVIRNNLIERTGGNGIIIRVAKNALVERNRAFYNGLKISGNAMFCFNTDSTLFQYNEAAFQVFSPGETDAAGIDSDFRTKYTLIQYNYLHDNGQGGVVATGGSGSPTTVARFNIGTVIRYNILANNNRYGVHTSGVLTGMLVHNNVFYTSAANPNVDVVDNGAWGGVWSDGDTYRNNIFANYGSSPDYAIGQSTNVTFDGNLYTGTFSVTEPADPNRVKANPLFVGPPTSPDGFMLQSTSPALGAGVLVPGLPATDYFGNALPASGPLDIGAHQRSVVTAAEDAPEAGADVLTASPNPARGAVALSFEMAAPGRVRIALFDVLGRQVLEQTEALTAGRASVRLEALALPAGAYVVRIDRGDARSLTQRITLLGTDR